MSSNLPLVSLLTLLPFLGGIAVLLLGRAGRSAARLTAAAFATAAVAYTIVLWCRFQPAMPGMQLQELHRWEPAIGLGVPRRLGWPEPADAGRLLHRRAHGGRRFLEQSETRAGLFCFPALSGDGALRHLYGAELSPLVPVSGS